MNKRDNFFMICLPLLFLLILSVAIVIAQISKPNLSIFSNANLMPTPFNLPLNESVGNPEIKELKNSLEDIQKKLNEINLTDTSSFPPSLDFSLNLIQ